MANQVFAPLSLKLGQTNKKNVLLSACDVGVGVGPRDVAVAEACGKPDTLFTFNPGTT